ncbi:ATP-binding protein [Wolbachia endosymbiont (group A) of Pipizella viduata]|uniref:ATP-binding protein n=1 Tax=Wolbachia endosymbiont (group A) of Pipizella viduata TaxID=3066154 RepID=UPI00333E98F9
MKIIDRDERLKTQAGITAVIIGPAGIGKTSLLKTIDKPTLCLDIEEGLGSVKDWDGGSIEIETWNDIRDIACLLGGPNPAVRADQAYSQKHYEYAFNKKKELSQKLSQYQCIFFDSMTAASRLCLAWAQLHPDVFSEKTGKANEWAAFGKLAQEMIGWLIQLQHIKDKDIILTATLGKSLDEFNRQIWTLQCGGNKTNNEIPGIVDEMISMVGLKNNEGKEIRSFVCQTINSWGYPAKDRSGCLDMVEEPHLGKLLAKIKAKAFSTAA